MKAKEYRMSPADGKVIEPVVRDQYAHIMHMVLPKGERMPIHETNANLYLTVLTGSLMIALDGEEAVYPTRTILNIPKGILMDARNAGEDTLELLVVKTPAPV